MNCYLIKLPTTNAGRDTAIDGRFVDRQYIKVENGALYVVAENATDVVMRYPNLLSLERIGVGAACIDE